MPSQFQSVVDAQIRAAEARGAFDNLPGAGKPIPGTNTVTGVQQMPPRQKRIAPGIGFPAPGRSSNASAASAARICASTTDRNWDGIVIDSIVANRPVRATQGSRPSRERR